MAARYDESGCWKTSDPRRRFPFLPHDVNRRRRDLQIFGKLTPQTSSCRKTLWDAIQKLACRRKVIGAIIEVTVVSRNWVLIVTVSLLGGAGDPSELHQKNAVSEC